MKKEFIAVPGDELYAVLEEILSKQKDVRFTITGNSMWPFLLHRRDQVILEKKEEIKLGDIVFIHGKQGYLLHRVMKKKAGRIITAGDGNCYYDGEFSDNQVIGVATQLIRKGKNISCDSLGWKTIFLIWRKTFRIRHFLLNLIIVLAKIKLYAKNIFHN